MSLVDVNKPFLPEADWARFLEFFESRLSEIAEGSSVINACVDRTEFIAVLFAGLEKQCSVFLCNSDWRESDWAQVQVMGAFDYVFGDSPIRAMENSVKVDQRIMVPTGGTSGGVRFCVHSLDTLNAAVESLQTYSGQNQLDSVNLLPLFHVSGLMSVMRAWATGGIVQLESWGEIKEGKFPDLQGSQSSMSLVPTQILRLMQLDEEVSWLRGFETIYVGGAGVSAKFIESIRSLKLPIRFVYGMTETAAMVAIAELNDVDANEKVWGHALPGVKLSLSSDGLIEVSSKSLFYGYYPGNKNEETFTTTDLGEFDQKGRLSVLGRNDFLINTGGEKVNPIEVENTIREFVPKSKVAVCGIEDPEWGEKVVALIENELSPEEISNLQTKLQSALESFKQPKEILTGIALPFSSLGKLKRGELREICHTR